MKQILHILRKDIRHYWREGLVSIAVIAAFAWNEVHSWSHQGDLGEIFSNRFLFGLGVALVPLSWWFLVVRVIQGESLVGDRQFWTTRPYEWKKLLVAKFIFVLLFVNLPLFLVQMFLLARAGFTPTHHLSGLLWLQLVPLFLILPVATLATVTSTVVQTALAALGVILYIIALAALSSQIPSADFSSDTDPLQALLLCAACLFVILWQYSRRKTARSRWVVAGTAAAILVIMVATPYRALIARHYPPLPTGENAPVQFELIHRPEHSDNDVTYHDDVGVQIPLRVSGMADQSIVAVRGVLVTLQARDGWQWNSGWNSRGIYLFPQRKSVGINFELPRKVFDRIKSFPVKVHLSLALALLHDRDPQQFVTPPKEFTMPGAGACSVDSGYIRGIRCRAPLRKPSSLLVTTDLSKSTCPAQDADSHSPPGTMGHAWAWNPGSEPVDFEFSPVQIFDFYVWADDDSRGFRNDGICPGTPLILSKPELDRQILQELDFDEVRINDYRGGLGRFSIASR
jgi:hypothetical protein